MRSSMSIRHFSSSSTFYSRTRVALSFSSSLSLTSDRRSFTLKRWFKFCIVNIWPTFAYGFVDSSTSIEFPPVSSEMSCSDIPGTRSLKVLLGISWVNSWYLSLFFTATSKILMPSFSDLVNKSLICGTVSSLNSSWIFSFF